MLSCAYDTRAERKVFLSSRRSWNAPPKKVRGLYTKDGYFSAGIYLSRAGHVKSRLKLGGLLTVLPLAGLS